MDGTTQRKPRVLVTNDDGINAPGLKAMVAAVVKLDCCEVYVCAPSGERSAQSHAITLGRYMSCAPTEVPGCKEAYAVDGTPADSVMLALHSNLLSISKGEGVQTPDQPCTADFDLVISGINRGDNCGLHVIYSGTVGAAREAACKGVPAIAFSLDNHMARKADDYTVAAALTASVVKAALGLLPGQSPSQPPVAQLRGNVVNVNYPICQGQMLQGFHLTHQSVAGVFPAFKEVQEAGGPHLAEIDEHTPNSRVFRNYAGVVQEDDAEGGDAWAVKNGWVSVTPLGIRQDIARVGNNIDRALSATAAIIKAAAADAGVSSGGISKL